MRFIIVCVRRGESRLFCRHVVRYYCSVLKIYREKRQMSLRAFGLHSEIYKAFFNAVDTFYRFHDNIYIFIFQRAFAFGTERCRGKPAPLFARHYDVINHVTFIAGTAALNIHRRDYTHL